MKNKIEEILHEVGLLGQQTGIPVYVVGGFVRDKLLGLESQDLDFVVEGDGPAFAEKAQNTLGGYGLTVHKRFGTASFQVKSIKIEFVTARKESYSKDSRNPVVEQTDLETDLTRRDFTVNAMAMCIDPDSFGHIIDPFHGKKDLKKKKLRTPLDPKTTFSDDPLRMMRAARFASQLQFEIDSKTLKAMTSERERLAIITQERITDEMLKILSHPKPSIGFRILQQTGILQIIFPEMDDLVGVEQRDQYHHKDVFEHTMKVLDNTAKVTDNINLRFAALVHDIGKPKVKRFQKGVGWTFHGHEQVGVQMLKKICARLKLSNEMERYSSKLTQLHMRPIHLVGEEVTDSAVRRLIVHGGEEIEDLLTLCRADITSGNPKRVQKHLANFDAVADKMRQVEEKDRLRAFQSPVRGEEIMSICGLKPGPEVGKIKAKIEEAILDGVIPNEYEAAKAYLIEMKNKL